jgi:hypothetical protein
MHTASDFDPQAELLARDREVFGFSVELDGKRIDPRHLEWDGTVRAFRVVRGPDHISSTVEL